MFNNLSNSYGFDISSGIQNQDISSSPQNPDITSAEQYLGNSSSMLNSVGISPNIMPSLKKTSITYPFIIWIYTTLYYIIIVCIVILINCNIYFLISYASDEKLMNLWFPTKCDDYPFGTNDNPTCPPINMREQLLKENNIPSNIPSEQSIPSDQSDPSDISNKWSKFIYKDKQNSDFPYNRFHKGDDLSINKEITNWYVLALSDTSIFVNRFNRSCLKKIHTVADDYPYFKNFVFCFGILLLLLVPINLVITGFKLLVNLVSGFFDLSWSSMIITFFIFLQVTPAWIIAYNIYKQFILTIKLMFYPLLMGQQTELSKIFDQYKKIIANIIGIVSIIALWQAPFDPAYSFIVKLVPTLFYSFLIIFNIFEYYMKQKI